MSDAPTDEELLDLARQIDEARGIEGLSTEESVRSALETGPGDRDETPWRREWAERLREVLKSWSDASEEEREQARGIVEGLRD